jgi:hypothetical protein
MHIAIDVGATDLLVQSQVIRHGLQAIGIVGHQHLRAHGFHQLANLPDPEIRDRGTLFVTECCLRFQQIKGQGRIRQDGGSDRENFVLTLACEVSEIQAEYLDVTRSPLRPNLA